MAILDAQVSPSNPQTLTATANSTDLIDTLAAHNLGAGRQIVVVVDIGAVSGTGPTLTVNFVGADDAGFSTNKITIATATPTLASGTPYGFVRMAIPSHTAKRYFRFEYTVAGTTPSIVINHAGLAINEQTTPMT